MPKLGRLLYFLVFKRINLANIRCILNTANEKKNNNCHSVYVCVLLSDLYLELFNQPRFNRTNELTKICHTDYVSPSSIHFLYSCAGSTINLFCFVFLLFRLRYSLPLCAVLSLIDRNHCFVYINFFLVFRIFSVQFKLCEWVRVIVLSLFFRCVVWWRVERETTQSLLKPLCSLSNRGLFLISLFASFLFTSIPSINVCHT